MTSHGSRKQSCRCARQAEQKLAKGRRHLQEKELRRQGRLVAETGAWNQAQLIRNYVAHLQAKLVSADNEGTTPVELEHWLLWAIEIAEKLDPPRSRLTFS